MRRTKSESNSFWYWERFRGRNKRGHREDNTYKGRSEGSHTEL